MVTLNITTTEFGELELTTEVIVYDLPILTPATLMKCDLDNDGQIVFNLEQANSNLSVQNNLTFKYFTSEEDALHDRNEIQAQYNSTRNNETIWVKAFNLQGCSSFTTITLIHEQVQNQVLAPIKICYSNHSIEINLADYIHYIEEQINPIAVVEMQFYQNLADLNEETNSITSFEMVGQRKTIFARVKSFDLDCDVVVELAFVPSDLPDFEIPNQVKCPLSALSVHAPEGYIYQWNGLTGQDLNQNLNSSSITIVNPGNYSVTLKNEDGCEITKHFTIDDFRDVELVQIKVENNNQLVVEAIGEGLMYSLDGVNWHNENVFVNLTTGVYTVYIKSLNGCVIQSGEVVIFLWVNFLSPNKDGSNDMWRIPGLEKYQNVEVKIFNRYGKLLLDKTMNNENVIWDGIYQNKRQPSDSYWYIISIPNHIKYSGHLLLKNKL